MLERLEGAGRRWFDKGKNLFTELGKLTPIALVTTFLPILGSTVLFAFGYPLGRWLRENPDLGPMAYLFGVLFVCGLALMPTNIIGLVGGFAFGFNLGLGLLMAAIVGAAFLSYLIHRRIAGDKVTDVADKHPKAKAIYEALTGQSFAHTTLVIFLIRLSVVMPFALTNFILASAKVPRSTFLVGTFFGMLPRSGAVVFAGAGLTELTLETSDNIGFLIFGIAATLLSVIVISFISRKALERLTEAEKG